ncbi:MAG: polysaccharide lyase family protein [Chthoniobacteraceae bacterium]
MNPLRLCLTLLLACAAAVTVHAEEPVTVVEDGSSFTLANGILTAKVSKRSGDLVSLRCRDKEMLGSGSGKAFGYWSHVGGGSLGSKMSSAVLADDGTRAIVSVKAGYDGERRSLPVDVDMRYALGRGESALAVYAIWDHPADYPGFSIAEARFGMKLNPAIFDYMTIDERRRKVMPTPEDWRRGERLQLKEVRRMTTGIHAGKAEHKYDYSAVQCDTPAFGWSSTEHKLGVWIVNPTIEYLSGGATKVELTAHLDVNEGAAPTLLNYWKGSHYGGSSLAVAQGEAWTRVIGPQLVYCNSAPDHEAMWKDALAVAAKEAKAWPYDWVSHPAYPPAKERATVTGRVVLQDSATMRNLLVGLAAPEYEQRGRWGGSKVDWQRDAKYYQFWARGGENGAFTLEDVRPGKYTLHAIADGVLGEYAKTEIEVQPGGTLDLGELTWAPVRHGRTLWEIGTPDRTAAEFKYGDQYWQWGLFAKYPQDFPDDVHFVIGKSDPRRDWNYVQPARPNASGRSSDTTWRISFDLDQPIRGKALLRLAIAGSRTERGVEVIVNDQTVGGTGRLPDTGVMHRDGIRGYWVERGVPFDAALLKPGTNTIQLHLPATSWVHGVLYDYLRLEVDESAS